MTNSEERLAPVTYLPGARPPEEAPAAAPSRDDEPVTLREVVAEAVERDTERTRRRAENVALHALTRRGMSRREVERTLRARELDEQTIEEELERLESVGLIDDTALAQDLVGRLQERKGLGRQAVAAELTRRLLSPAAIEYALELVEGSDELARAKELAETRARQLQSYDRETAVRRLSGYLARRGYDGSTVRAAVAHALPERTASSVRFR
ncbi:regulatory protein RecX [uncultured Schumannella sp.]|uniref:regulatory protein RecX n=1 Tax=uncultured Schumannella sp. TaxID=1195956 RepID=UPI0025E344B8|nr:regulatory protein RecX [uncultured Schumannella sp.]